MCGPASFAVGMRSGIGRAGGKAAGSTVRGALQDGQMPELQIAEQQENGEASTAGTEGQREEQMPDGTLSVTFFGCRSGQCRFSGAGQERIC